MVAVSKDDPARFPVPPGRQLLSQRKLGSRMKAGVCLVGQKTQLDYGPGKTGWMTPDLKDLIKSSHQMLRPMKLSQEKR